MENSVISCGQNVIPFGRREVRSEPLWKGGPFNEWMSANLSRLGDTIGVPLRERARKRMSEVGNANIFACEEANGSRVLVTPWCNHEGHDCGVAAFSPGKFKTMIWLAEKFDDSELQLFRMFYRRDGRRFMAVRVQLALNNQASVEPLFEIMPIPEPRRQR